MAYEAKLRVFRPYFSLLSQNILDPDFDLESLFVDLEFIVQSDSAKGKALFIPLFKEMIEL